MSDTLRRVLDRAFEPEDGARTEPARAPRDRWAGWDGVADLRKRHPEPSATHQ